MCESSQGGPQTHVLSIFVPRESHCHAKQGSHSGKASAVLPGCCHVESEALSREALGTTHNNHTVEAACVTNHRWADEERIVDAWRNLFILEEGPYIIAGKWVELSIIVLSKTEEQNEMSYHKCGNERLKKKMTWI